MAPPRCHHRVMDLTPYVDNLRHELAVAADAGGEEARALAERLTTPLESATRLTLLNALSIAMEEITRELAPGSVDVRLRGLDPEFVVTAPPCREAYEEAEGPPAVAHDPPPPVSPVPPGVPDGEEGGPARINFRLPAHLKTRIEDAAGQEALSINTWLIRAVATALEQPGAQARPAVRRHNGQQGLKDWAR